jgi:capsular exopolysaccharide synthesis family protein
VDKPLKTVLVTSTVAEEGKTTLSLNLASAYALGGFRTILVEADLRRPSLHRVFGMNGTRGLTTVIVGSVDLNDAVIHTATRNLSVLLAGAIPPNPVELLGSEQLTEVLDRLRLGFDVVIIDSPPIGPVADASAIAARCDGVVIVVRAGRTDRRRLLDSLRLVERAGGKLLGIAMNFLSRREAPDEYGEYYYYGYRAAEARSTVDDRGHG